MVNAFGCLLAFALPKRKKVTVQPRMEDWFRIEYGKDWKHALKHYDETGSIHWKG